MKITKTDPTEWTPERHALQVRRCMTSAHAGRDFIRYSHPEYFYRLAWFIHEREGIRLRRAKGIESPWTTDPVLRDGFFTNVDRRLDPGTIFVVNSVLPRFNNADLIRAVLCYRFFNRIATAQALSLDAGNSPWSSLASRRQTEKTLLAIVNKGGKIFTSAHFVHMPSCGQGKTGDRSVILHRFLDEVLWPACVDGPRLVEEIIANGEIVLRSVFNALKELNCVGDFLANQFTLDLSMSPLLANATDAKTFAYPGPGAKKYLSRLLVSCDKKPDEKIQMVTIALNLLFTGTREMECQDTEHALCESEKHVATSASGGFRRRWNANRGKDR